MNHLDRQLSSKRITDKKGIVVKFMAKRVRSAARRAQRMSVLPPVGIALMASEAAIIFSKVKNMKL